MTTYWRSLISSDVPGQLLVCRADFMREESWRQALAGRGSEQQQSTDKKLKIYISTLNSVRMPGTSGDELPTDPPPDYDYAVNHPAEQVSLPEYRVAVKLPSYQQAVLDKGLFSEDFKKINKISTKGKPLQNMKLYNFGPK